MYYANILSERLKTSDHQQKRGSKIASNRGETPERACEKQVDVLMSVRDALVSLYMTINTKSLRSTCLNGEPILV